jgi:hypothetical protein
MDVELTEEQIAELNNGYDIPPIAEVDNEQQ